MDKVYRLLQIIFFAAIVRPIILIVLGLRIDGRENLPKSGPAVLIANHNSHLDTLVLMSIYPLRKLHRMRPVSAADYFLRTPLKRWFSTNIIRVIPMIRPSKTKPKSGRENPFEPIFEAIGDGDIVIFFPEGSRGAPEQLTAFHNGIARIAQHHPDVPIVPIFMHGLGKALPKGDFVLVPFFCDIIIGEALTGVGRDRQEFMSAIEEEIAKLTHGRYFASWD